MRRSDEAVRPFALPHSSPTQHSALQQSFAFRTPQSEIGTPQHAFITPHSAFRTPQAAPTIHIPHSAFLHPPWTVSLWAAFFHSRWPANSSPIDQAHSWAMTEASVGP